MYLLCFLQLSVNYTIYNALLQALLESDYIYSVSMLLTAHSRITSNARRPNTNTPSTTMPHTPPNKINFNQVFSTKKGLTLQNGPGNDIVAVTNLMAAGAHVILFTTGRGTPLGSAVPTLKIATNSMLAKKKANWIDFDAGRVLTGNDCTQELVDLVIDVANGALAKNEINGYEEISIFKDGVTL